MKAETEKPLSPEFQANRSKFRYPNREKLDRPVMKGFVIFLTLRDSGEGLNVKIDYVESVNILRGIA